MIFLDTGFFFALFDQNDANHVRVREVVERERGKRLSDFVVTTNHVVGETLTLARTRGAQDALWRHARAVEIGRQLHAGVFGLIHHVTEDEERAAFEYLPSTPTRRTASWTAQASW